MNTVSVVIPTRNERENIKALLPQVLKYGYEAIVVDDSDDDTAQIAELSGAKVLTGQHKGLGQAILDGIKEANSELVVVMDADLSHSPQSIKDLINPILKHGCDMTIGSRYIKGGKTQGWGLKRRIISRVACLIALPITSIHDSTSGFFAFRKSILNGIRLTASSWKIMLEILVKANPLVVKEIPITFVVRQSGKSKFNAKQVLAYLRHVLKLVIVKYQKFIKFCFVGSTGALITFSITWILTEMAGMWYMFSMAVAVGTAAIWNFNLNLLWTFKAYARTDTPYYEWNAFYRGNPVQRWWKRSIAETVWKWIPNGQVLDIGCGSSPIIAKYENSVGVDVNPDKLKFMSDRCRSSMFTGLIPNHSSKFENIICIEVLEHLPDAESLVAQISDLLVDNGKAVIATPDYNRKLWHLAEKFTPYKEEHITKFSRQSLEALCRKYHLEPVKYKYVASCDLVELFIKNGK